MRINHCIYVLIFFSLYSLSFSQGSPTSVVDKLSFGIDFLYYNPKVDYLNAGFSKIENKLSLLKWRDFKIDFLAIANVLYSFDRKNQIAVQFGGSYIGRTREDYKSYYYLWLAGGEYRYRLLARTRPTTEFYVTLGAGLISAKFRRSYSNDVSLFAFGRKPYINTGLLIAVQVIKEIDININARYMFVPTMKFNSLNSELSLKSVNGGIGISYSF